MPLGGRCHAVFVEISMQNYLHGLFNFPAPCRGSEILLLGSPVIVDGCLGGVSLAVGLLDAP